MKSIDSIKQDYQMFIDIQMSKFLKLTGQLAFKNDKEANEVLKTIIDVYNDQIASDHLRLDNLNFEAKAAWFNSVNINFKEFDLDIVDIGDLAFTDKKKSVQDARSHSDKSTPDDFNEFINEFDDRFEFLPDGALHVILYGLPLLQAYGYPFERFKDIVSGEKKPQNFEKDLLLWVFDTTLAIIDSVLVKNKKERELAYSLAIEIAEDFLDEDEAEQVVKYIEDFYKKDTLNEKKGSKRNSKTTNKKNK